MNQIDSSLNSESIILSENSISYLDTTRKWTKFLSILGFVGMGILILIGLGLIIAGLIVGNTINASFPLTLLGLVYLVLAAINLIPNWYLFKFSTAIEHMANGRNSLKGEEAFKYLMSFYRFKGILVIVFLGIYFIAMILSVFIGFGALTTLS